MTYVTCINTLGGYIDIIDSDMVEELVIDGNDHIKTMFVTKAENQRRKQRMRRPQSTPHTRHRSAAKLDSEALIGHTLKLQDWLNEKSIKSIQEKADLEAKNARKMYTTVLDTEATFVKELENSLKNKELLDLRKKEMLHKKWSEKVHEPIRRQIDKEMHGPNYKELAQRKRELHKEYLEHVNRKGHVFLDTFAPEEYYPLTLNPVRPSPLIAETKALKDPLLSQERERNEEDRIIIRCMTGSTLTDKDLSQVRLPPLPLVPLGRHGTECSGWLAMPMGDIESPVRLASRRRMKESYHGTQINFDKWSKLTYTPSVIEEEMQTQKKRSFSRNNIPAKSNPNPSLSSAESSIGMNAQVKTQSVAVQVQS